MDDFVRASPAMDRDEVTDAHGLEGVFDETTIAGPGIEDEDEDDEPCDYVSPVSADDLYLRNSEVDGADDVPLAELQSRMWKIDHSFGNYNYKRIQAPILFPTRPLSHDLFGLESIYANWQLMGSD